VADMVLVTLTVLEKENTDRFDGHAYPPTLLELLHKFEDGFINFVLLPLKKRMTTRGRRNSGSKRT